MRLSADNSIERERVPCQVGDTVAVSAVSVAQSTSPSARNPNHFVLISRHDLPLPPRNPIDRPPIFVGPVTYQLLLPESVTKRLFVANIEA